MISQDLYFTLLYIWIGIAVVTIPFLLKITVPYGRHTSNTWGPMINNKFGWFIMEAPVIIVFSWLFFIGDAEKSLLSYIFYGLFMLHYFNRVFIFPLQLKGKKKKMPLLVVVFAIVLTCLTVFLMDIGLGTFRQFMT